MCIICRMRKAGASEEVLNLANELMEAFQTSMMIHQEVLNEDRKHDAKEIAALYGMRDAMNVGNEPEDKAGILQQLLGKNIKVVVVRPNENESFEDAVNRTIDEDGAGNTTVH